MEQEKSKSLSLFIVIFLLSLVFIRPFISGIAYNLFEFYYEIFIICLAVLAIINKRESLTLPSCHKAILIILSSYIISTIASVNIQNSIKETLKFISYIAVFFTVSQLNNIHKKILIKAMVIAALIISLYTIYQYFWGYQHTLEYIKKINSDFLLTSFYARDTLLSKRAIGTFPSSNILGGYLVMIFFLAIHSLKAWLQEISNSPFKAALKSILIITLIFSLILTKSMGAWLSLILTLILLIVISYNQVEPLGLKPGDFCEGLKKQKWIIAISSILIFFILLFIISNRWERFINLEDPHNSITQRLNYWRAAIGIIKDHPFIGVGPGNFQEVFLKYKAVTGTNTRYAHNIFLHQWAETGMLGFLGISSIIFHLLRKLQVRSIEIMETLIPLSAIAFLLHNLIDNTYFIPETGLLWWAIIGLVFFRD